MSVILVTGASRGIGLEIVRQAAARGDEVIACARAPEDATGLAAAAAEAGGRIETLTLDVESPESCAALAAALAGRRIDLLVCNAGVFVGRGGLDDPAFSAETWAATMSVNVAGVFFTVRALHPLLAAPGGRVAIVSSRMGSSELAGGGAYAYRASKAAVTNLAANLAVDLRQEGIAVGAYHPGWVKTDMGTQAAAVAPEDSAAGLLARFDALVLETSGAFETFQGEGLPF